MSKVTEVLSAILKEFQDMPQEKFDSIISSMYETAGLSQKLFEEFLDELSYKKQIDNEDILYSPEEFWIKEKDFLLVIDYLNYTIKQNNLILTYEEDNPFPHFNCKFNYKDILFNMRMVSGQGTMYQFDIIEDNENILEFNSIALDENVKFERIKRK